MKPLDRANLYAVLLAVPLAALCAWLAVVAADAIGRMR